MKSLTKITTKFLAKQVLKQWKLFVLLMIGVTVNKYLLSITPVYYKDLINALSGGQDNLGVVYGILFGLLTIKLFAWISNRVFEFGINTFEPRVMKSIGDDCFRYLHRHSYDFFVNNFAGSLVKKVNRLSRSFEMIMDRLAFNLYPLILRAVISLWLLYTISPTLSLILFVWSVIFIIVNYFFSKYRMKMDSQINEIDSKLGGILADTISNNFNISLFATHDSEQENYEKVSSTWEKIFVRSWNISALGDALQALLMLIVEIVLFYVAIGYWRDGAMTVGDFILMQGVLVQLLDNIWSVGRIIRDLARGYADANEMIEILEKEHEILDKPGAKEIEIKQGKIEVKNLTFKYNENRNVFDNFSLKIEPGKKVALVSRSGGGKSTLIKLLLRFYNVPDGSIFIDDQDIMTVTQDSLRRSISLVPQDPILFHRTLAENIAYGKPGATKEEIIEAAKKARCHEFISELPEGYETYVGERGIKLSGGERQRVAIARAILEDAPILILDEATSSLDSESEHLIQEALAELMRNKTTIAVAHRLSTIIQMDEIIVFEKGKITEIGNHTELLTHNESQYKKLWEIQAGGFGAVNAAPNNQSSKLQVYN